MDFVLYAETLRADAVSFSEVLLLSLYEKKETDVNELPSAKCNCVPALYIYKILKFYSFCSVTITPFFTSENAHMFMIVRVMVCYACSDSGHF